jgi:hypothetical protein
MLLRQATATLILIASPGTVAAECSFNEGTDKRFTWTMSARSQPTRAVTMADARPLCRAMPPICAIEPAGGSMWRANVSLVDPPRPGRDTSYARCGVD